MSSIEERVKKLVNQASNVKKKRKKLLELLQEQI